MKKRIAGLFLVVAMFIFALAGCAGKGTENQNTDNDGNNPGTSQQTVSDDGSNNENSNDGEGYFNFVDGIRITDKYVFEVPDGLDCDTVYVVECDSSSEMVKSFNEDEIMIISFFDVIFSNKGELVAEVAIYVCADEELTEIFTDEGYIVPDEDSEVAMYIMETEELAQYIEMYQENELLPDSFTPEDYAEFQAENYGGTILKEIQ